MLAALVRQRLRSGFRSLRTWPSAQGWREATLVGASAALAILALGFGTGLLSWQPPDESLWPLFLRALVVPALAEEFVFRGLLTPARGEERRPALVLALALAAFVLWHVAGGLLLPGAGLFLRPDFLLCASILGLACIVVRYRTGSLWPPVLFHALVVWAWQAFLGGISPTDLIHLGLAEA